MTYTIVSFHAHPDDESLLTAGTLARAAADGHRVVLVVATAGEAGLAADPTGLGRRRTHELAASARAIGAARVEVLGYPDGRFAETDTEEAAELLAAILREERADVLTTYDRAGGYGHPDHVQVHRVGHRAAELAGTRVLLEATIDRTLIARLLAVLRRVPASMPELPGSHEVYTARADLTHRVDVRRHLPAKLGSMRAHASQTGGGSGPRTLALLLRLPRPLARTLLGQEWYREVGRVPGRQLEDDIFATLRSAR
ncbi:PIG-L family deacetylase [Nocardioides sp. CN2-186]|uniref:PIG-L deacetylase family protein n=1 Tax=Nocardioides tweenelious TaxID=3156607 RepID=UPI0032B49E21